jgi:hypothetical protein
MSGLPLRIGGDLTPFGISSYYLAAAFLFSEYHIPPMWLATVLLLTVSNVFMTFAWYGHLKYKATALWVAIVVSWLIAFLEYCFQVPANRLGHMYGMPAAQLKTIQEVITFTVFCLFSMWYLHEPLKWNDLVGFALITLGAVFVFAPWQVRIP